jgi:hypothetical protein
MSVTGSWEPLWVRGVLGSERGVEGQPSRRGEIVELLGGAGHEHYRVRWDEQHESIVYPADGIIITPQRAHPASR